jgi:hypothetical protein
MEKARRIVLTLLILGMHAACGGAGGAAETAADGSQNSTAERAARFPETQTSATEKVVLLGILRGNRWPTMEASPRFSGFDLPAGKELLVVRYTVEEVPGANMPKPLQVSLGDASEEPQPQTKDVVVSTQWHEDAFVVGTGAKLGTLRINATKFDLRELPTEPGTHGKM